jgi:DNA-binding XRE family transcriptional regulator
MTNNRLPTNTSAELIHVVDSRRNELDITLEALAHLSGVSRRTMNACLSGHTEMSLRLLLRIASALHLTVQLLPEVDRAKPVESQTS